MKRRIVCLCIFLNLLFCLTGSEKPVKSSLIKHSVTGLNKPVIMNTVLGLNKVTSRKKLTYKPRGGTVSHHMLAAEYINNWFCELKENSDIDTFVIITPDHLKMSSNYLTVSDLPWICGEKVLYPDIKGIVSLSEKADIPIRPAAFQYEHGIGTLVPFILKFFPHSRVIPIMQKEENLDLKRLDQLTEELILLIKNDKKKNYFILVSTDFSHHADTDETYRRDKKNETLLSRLSCRNALKVWSDNRGGLYLLARYIGAVGNNPYTLINHTDSLSLSGQQPQDITSYFFSFY